MAEIKKATPGTGDNKGSEKANSGTTKDKEQQVKPSETTDKLTENLQTPPVPPAAPPIAAEAPQPIVKKIRTYKNVSAQPYPVKAINGSIVTIGPGSKIELDYTPNSKVFKQQ